MNDYETSVERGLAAIEHRLADTNNLLMALAYAQLAAVQQSTLSPEARMRCARAAMDILQSERGGEDGV